MMKNNKGFTLVELMAVVVILIVIIVIAITVIKTYTLKAEVDSTKANATTYFKAANGYANLSKKEVNVVKNGIFTVEQLNSFGVKISGTTPSSGYLVFSNYEAVGGCLVYSNGIVTIENGEYDFDDDGTCNVEDNNIEYECSTSESYTYKGSGDVYIAPQDGEYQLEAWGAQGGNVLDINGGYGAYSTITIPMLKGDKLYINVGGQGVSIDTNAWTTDPHAGGYNGGGNGRSDGSTYFTSGGGATSISTAPGLIKDLATENLVLVAAGGGAAAKYGNNNNIGGSGGGISGTRGNGNCGGYGGTQLAGGSGCGDYNKAGIYGKGGSVEKTDNNNSNRFSGGGGGLYGGGSGYSWGSGGGGGSSYLNTSITGSYDATTYCYNCTESSVVETHTVSVATSSENPIERTPKLGNGYVHIELIVN